MALTARRTNSTATPPPQPDEGRRQLDVAAVMARIDRLDGADQLPPAIKGLDGYVAVDDQWTRQYSLQIPSPDEHPPDLAAAEAEHADLVARLATVDERLEQALFAGDTMAYTEATMEKQSATDLLRRSTVNVEVRRRDSMRSAAWDYAGLAATGSARREELEAQMFLLRCEARKWTEFCDEATRKSDALRRVSSAAGCVVDFLMSPAGIARHRAEQEFMAKKERGQTYTDPPAAAPPFDTLTVRGAKIVAVDGRYFPGMAPVAGRRGPSPIVGDEL